jgi:hypothetical protein
LKRDNLNVPVVLFVFSRPDTLKKVFDVLKKVKPKVLFLVSDAPRDFVQGEKDKVMESRKVVSEIDWECRVIKIYETTNQGLYTMLWSSMDKVFKEYDRCIFLEDDVVPSVSFFYFMEDLLEKFKDDERIQQISGMNFLDIYPKNLSDSYFYSKETSIWGFGLWRRTYLSFDREHSYGKNEYLLKRLKKNMPRSNFKRVINYVKHSVSDGHVAGFEYYFGLDKFINNRVSVVPKYNMISNIGCVNESQHENTYITMPKEVQRMYYMKTYELEFPLKHNEYVIEDECYGKKARKITGVGHPFISFRRKVITVFKLLRYEGFKGLKRKLKKKKRNKKET